MSLSKSLVVASLIGLKAALGSTVTTSVTVDSTCTITTDLATVIYDQLDLFVAPAHGALNAMINLGTSFNGSMVPLPFPGTEYSIPWLMSVLNNTLTPITWSMYNNFAGMVQYAESNGFTFCYGVTQLHSGPVIQIAPATPTASATAYHTPSSLYYYHFDEATGVVNDLTPFLIASYDLAQRSWFWPATVTTGLAYTQPQYSSFSGDFYQVISQQYGVSESTYPSYAPYHYKVAASYILFNGFSEYLATLNHNGGDTVAYVMTTANPTGLLIGSTTTAAANGTVYAADSTNAIIAGTAKYIAANLISTDTQVYVDSLGCMMTVKFWTYGSPDTLYTAPAEITTTPNVASAGLAYTVVSCVVEPAPQTTYTTTVETNDDASTSSLSSDEADQLTATQGLSATILVLVLVLTVLAFINLFSNKRAPMSQQATPATEMSSTSKA